MSDTAHTDIDAQPSTDGRRRRAEGSRSRIIAAMLVLVREGVTSPSAEQVADRADVSLRTVFRHFQDMERLYREMIGPVEAEMRAGAAKPFQATDWQGKVVEMVSRRAAIYELIAPLRLAADLHRHRSPSLAEATLRMTATSRAILNAQLPDGLRDSDAAEALDMLLSFDAWMRLRVDQNLSVERARAVLEGLVRQIVDQS